jgi:hypothetical protein
LPSDFAAQRTTPLPLTAGFVHFIRFVAQDGSFACLNETWWLDKQRWAGKTIRARLDTHQQQLVVFHQSTATAQPSPIAQFDYPLRERAQPLDPCFVRPLTPLWPAAD